MIPLVTIEGPTASGKTRLAIRLAEELGAEIISADSRQVYRFLDIGTAKPSSDEQDRVKHHLIDIIDPRESYNAGRFCTDAGAVIRELHSKGKLAIVCGGTGLYVSSLLRGLFPQVEISTEVRSRLRERLERLGPDTLYPELADADPDFAAGISSKDRQRILRGLEIFEATGIPISEHWRRQEKKQPYDAFRVLIDPPREILYVRINHRIQDMLAKGLLDEISNLFRGGYSPGDPGLNSLGYKEFLPYLLEGALLEDCAGLAAQHTRNYAKRQCTWYRKYKFDLTLTSDERILSEITGSIERRFQ
jgi:tRNA dimethylallyltransferase